MIAIVITFILAILLIIGFIAYSRRRNGSRVDPRLTQKQLLQPPKFREVLFSAAEGDFIDAEMKVQNDATLVIFSGFMAENPLHDVSESTKAWQDVGYEVQNKQGLKSDKYWQIAGYDVALSSTTQQDYSTIETTDREYHSTAAAMGVYEVPCSNPEYQEPSSTAIIKTPQLHFEESIRPSLINETYADVPNSTSNVIKRPAIS